MKKIKKAIVNNAVLIIASLMFTIVQPNQAQKQQVTLHFVESCSASITLFELQRLKDTLRLRDGELGELRGELKTVREINKL